ncbi:hypothetical protein EVAR_13161_1 [Eumeta japonica]|uniref:Uncharacterized protein n=1 Tax=Eumeta variegata TaxID=151549 RepID=A0A4C1UAK2_EUMVA|nr:hypothetical protein EVAR_13161_1 [Eumeta japonica]
MGRLDRFVTIKFNTGLLVSFYFAAGAAVDTWKGEHTVKRTPSGLRLILKVTAWVTDRRQDARRRLEPFQRPRKGDSAYANVCR